MYRVNLVRLMALLLAAAVLLAQTAPQPASVAGTVTNSVTGEPIPRAHMTLRCVPDDGQSELKSYGALSNDKGEFSMTGLDPGNCWVELRRAGFAPSPRQEGFAVFGARKEGMKLTLTPAGAITGRVLDAAGQPMEGVTAQADGVAFGFAETDEKGEFRIGGLLPGKYRVKAIPQNPPYPPEIRADGSTELKDSATYYPNSLDAKTAQRIEVKAGAEVSGVEIRIVQTAIVAVSGKIIGLTPGAKGARVIAFPSAYGAMAKSDGSFTLWRLDPGKYVMHAIQNGGPAMVTSAPVDIEVANTNVEQLELRMIPPFPIAGRLQFDDEQAREPAKPAQTGDGRAAAAPPLRVEIQPIQPWIGQLDNVTVSADDSFTFERVQPARYRVTVSWPTAYVKSIRAGDTRIDGDILDVRNGSPGPLTLTLSSAFCEITGVVRDSQGPIADAQVALVSLNDWSGTKVEPADSRGNYKFSVTPGKYKLAALDAGLTLWTLPSDILDDYDDVAETLTLSAGDKVSKDLVRHK